jgi:hypothetical protein
MTAGHDPLELLAGANPASAAALQSEMTVEQHFGALERAIALGDARVGVPIAKPVRRPFGWRKAFALCLVGAAAATLTAVVLLGGSPVGTHQPDFAGAAVKIAETSPRILVGAPGWSVRRVNEFTLAGGTVEFSDGTDDLLAVWTRTPPKLRMPLSGSDAAFPKLGQWYRTYLRGCTRPVGSTDGCRTFTENVEIPFLGRRAVLHEDMTIRHDGDERHQFAVVAPPNHGLTLTLDGSADSRAEFLKVLGTVHTASVDEWLGALPPRIVAPVEHPGVVEQILRGVPVPAAVDVDAIKSDLLAGSPRQVRIAVVSAVACGWLDKWRAALQSGNAPAEAKAERAMASSTDWPVLVDMHQSGLWPHIVRQIAIEMATRPNLVLSTGGAFRITPTGAYRLSPGYAATFGCASGRWVPEEGATNTVLNGGPPAVAVDAPR